MKLTQLEKGKELKAKLNTIETTLNLIKDQGVTVIFSTGRSQVKNISQGVADAITLLVVADLTSTMNAAEAEFNNL